MWRCGGRERTGCAFERWVVDFGKRVEDGRARRNWVLAFMIAVIKTDLETD